MPLFAYVVSSAPVDVNRIEIMSAARSAASACRSPAVTKLVPCRARLVDLGGAVWPFGNAVAMPGAPALPPKLVSGVPFALKRASSGRSRPFTWA